jgi:hypothetical protein
MSAQLKLQPPPPGTPTPRRALTHGDAVEIWIARWLRTPQRQLLARYGCDPRRLYEIWQEDKFPGSRDAALAELFARFPTTRDRFDPGAHRPIPRSSHPDQLALFD